MGYKTTTVAILGGGNIGCALAEGWAQRAGIPPGSMHVTRRDVDRLQSLRSLGFHCGSDNRQAVSRCNTLVLAVQPQQLMALVDEIRDGLEPGRHRLISIVSGVTVAQIAEMVGKPVPIVRAMPNTAIAIGESMTCLSAPDGCEDALAEAEALFAKSGRTLVIRENMMIPATALCACGVAFFLRSIRAASQGGIEIGFHPAEALLLAAQTARGAAALVLGEEEHHPESEIDRVTTPRGCTIAGLNEMEHQGFSSAMIKGILLSAEKAGGLFEPES